MGSFAVINIALAMAAHRLAGGARPLSLVIGPALVALVAIAWLSSRRERSGRQVTALVVGCQTVLHVLFELPVVLVRHTTRAGAGSTPNWAVLLFCHHGSQPITSTQIRTALSGLDTTSLQTRLGQVPPPASPIRWVPITMLTAHLLAAVVMAWWLRRGERAAWAAACRVVRVVLRRAPALPPLRRSAVGAPTRARVLVSSRLATALGSRAPPSRSAVFVTA